MNETNLGIEGEGAEVALVGVGLEVDGEDVVDDEDQGVVVLGLRARVRTRKPARPNTIG